MKIYILKSRPDYEDDNDLGYFTTLEKAEAYKQALLNDEPAIYDPEQLYIEWTTLDPEY